VLLPGELALLRQSPNPPATVLTVIGDLVSSSRMTIDSKTFMVRRRGRAGCGLTGCSGGARGRWHSRELQTLQGCTADLSPAAPNKWRHAPHTYWQDESVRRLQEALDCCLKLASTPLPLSYTRHTLR
jgi:hypothetical protein